MQGLPSYGVLFSSRQTVPTDGLSAVPHHRCALALGSGWLRDAGSAVALSTGWGCKAQV